MSWSSFQEWEMQSMDGSINEYTTTLLASGLSPRTDFERYRTTTSNHDHNTGLAGDQNSHNLVFQDSSGYLPQIDASPGTSPSASSNGALSYNSPNNQRSRLHLSPSSKSQSQPHYNQRHQEQYPSNSAILVLESTSAGDSLHTTNLISQSQSPSLMSSSSHHQHQHQQQQHQQQQQHYQRPPHQQQMISPPPLASLSNSPQRLTNNVDVISSGDLSNIPPSVLFANNAIKARPCDICRHRKARCVLEKGCSRCTYCESKNLTCTFIKGPRPRKKSAGTNGPGGGSKKDSTDGLDNISTVSNHSEKRKRLSNDTSDGEDDAGTIRNNVRPVQDYSTIRGHSLLKKTMSLQYPRSSVYLGPTSVYDSRLFELGHFDKLDQTPLTGEISVRRPVSDIFFALNNDDTYEIAIEDTDAIERIIAPHGKALIDLYFRIVHPSFPILHKKVFLEKYSRTHREFSAPLLAAVYILALNWWYYDPELSSLPKPDVAKLRKMAQSTFNKVLEHPKLSSVQAGLLLLQCGPNNARSWSICSQVTALSEELGLGLNCQNWRIPKWERGLRRRLAWAVYLQDKWLSLIESRPSHITSQNWLVKRLTSDDFPETAADDSSQEGSADIEDGKLLFMEMVSLGEIVEEILNTLFTLESKQNIRTTEETLQYGKPIQIKLKKWYQKLPEPLKMVSTKPRRLSSNGYLHLAYFAAEITLHRRIIRTLDSNSSQELVQVCREAARERLVAALEFVKSLRPEHIQSFWHFSAPANFALIGTFAAILHVTAINQEESDFYKNQLSEYLWTLRVSSGFPQMAAALQMLTVATTCIPGLKSENGQQKQSRQNSHPQELYSDERDEDEEEEDEEEEGTGYELDDPDTNDNQIYDQAEISA